MDNRQICGTYKSGISQRVYGWNIKEKQHREFYRNERN